MSLAHSFRQGGCPTCVHRLKAYLFIVPFKVFQHFMQKASGTSVNAEANEYMDKFTTLFGAMEPRTKNTVLIGYNEHFCQRTYPAPYMQSTRSVHAEVLKNYERGSIWIGKAAYLLLSLSRLGLSQLFCG